MSLKAKDIDLHVLDTSKGRWGIFVQAAIDTEGNGNIFLKTILEQEINDEKIRMRTLEILVLELDLTNSIQRNKVLDQIRTWIDTTEGDGFLDLTSRAI
jgi:hypothetical protein